METAADATGLFRSDSAAKLTCGAPVLIAAQTTGSSIQPGIETVMLNGIGPQAWLVDTLARTPDYKINRIDDLLP